MIQRPSQLSSGFPYFRKKRNDKEQQKTIENMKKGFMTPEEMYEKVKVYMDNWFSETPVSKYKRDCDFLSRIRD